VTRSIIRRMRALVLVSCLALWAPAAASAAAPVPEDFSAADQYVESVPTSEGSKPTGQPNQNPPPALGAGGGDKLEQVATSPELGAPQKRLHDAKADEPDAPSALVGAIGEQEGGGSNLLWLVIAVLLVSGVVAGTAGHRHYRNRQTAGGA
jgi:hypothetical protein